MGATSADSATHELRAITSLWWLTILVGVLGVVAGVIVLLKPSNSLATIAVVIGIFAVIDGIVSLVRAIVGDTASRGLSVLIGVLGLIVGLLLIRHPIHGVTAVAILFGIWLIAMGAIRLVLVFSAGGHRVWRAVVAIVELVAGIVIVSSPGIGITTLAILVGIALIVNGVALAAAGFVLHGAREELQ
jgi:uncharacterized membrane protein HdeD (DUF308 family)